MSQVSGLQPLDGSGGVDLGLPVRAINRSDAPVTWTYARVKYVLPPATPTFVPYMAMVYYQGDPRSIDVPGGRQHEQFRRKEYEHLRILYGIYEEGEGHNKWADIPLVECYPIDSDVRFETVLHDPEGNHLNEKVQDRTQAQFMQAELERMAGQMRMMQAQLQQQQNADAAVAAADMDPEALERQETDHRAVTPEEATGQSMVGPSPQRRAPQPKASVTRDGE